MIISGLIHTKDEEYNIKNAILSLIKWVDEIIVVDMNSTDKTIDIAKSYGCRIINVNDMGYADPVRELGRMACNGDWIITLDADEMIKSSLADFLRNVALNDMCDVVAIPRMNYILGHWMSGPEHWPDFQYRFYKRNSISWDDHVHTHPKIIDGNRLSTINLSANPMNYSIIHFAYFSSSQFIDKINRYTNFETTKLLEKNNSYSLSKQAKESLYLLSLKLKNSSVIDVPVELTSNIAVFQGFYEWLKWFKLWEIESGHSENNVKLSYKKIADSILNDLNISN